MTGRSKSQLSWQERELACRLEIERKDKRDLTTYHPLQADRSIDRRTWHCRLIELGIAIVEKGKYDAVLLGRGPAWDAFVRSTEGEVLRNSEFVRDIELRARLRQWLPRPSKGNRADRPVIKVRRAIGSTSPMGVAKVIPLRPRMQNIQQPDKL